MEELDREIESEAAASAISGTSDTHGPDHVHDREPVSMREEILDSILVALLAIAGLAAAWSGYQANLWNGIQSANYAQASSKRIESTRQSTYGHQLTIVDVITFTNYVDAFAVGDQPLADFYATRFRPDFQPAFSAWIASTPLANPDAPISPFVMPEYVLPQAVDAARLEVEAGELFKAGQEANQKSDNYVLNTVILATVLFFAGIAPRVIWLPARYALVAVALAMLITGFYNIATYPRA